MFRFSLTSASHIFKMLFIIFFRDSSALSSAFNEIPDSPIVIPQLVPPALFTSILSGTNSADKPVFVFLTFLIAPFVIRSFTLP